MPLRHIVRDLTAEGPPSPVGDQVRRCLDAQRTPAVAMPLWAIAYVAATLAGRRIVVDGLGIAAVWPSVGVCFLWLAPWLFRRSGLREPAFWSSLAFVLGVTPLVNAWTGLPSVLLPWTGVTNVVAAVLGARLYVALRRSWRRELMTAADLALLALACLGGTAVAWLTFPLPGLIAGVLSWSTTWFWFLRNFTALFYFAVLGLLFLGERRRYISVSSPWSMAVSAIVATMLLGWMIMDSQAGVVLAFLFLVCCVASASFLSVIQGAAYLAVLGVGLIGSTVSGYGPYVGMPPEDSAVLVHVVLIISALVALSLALDREERAVLFHRLELDQARSAEQAELLRTIVGSMSEGILVMDGSGSVRMRNQAAAALLEGASSAGRAEGRRTGASATDVEDELGGSTPSAPVTDLVLRDDTGNPIRVVAVESHALPHTQDGSSVAIVRDVTEERRQIAELRTFARVAAHDLRQPLAAIELWVDTLRGELEDNGVPAGTESLDQIEAAAARMEAFLGDLVHYTIAREGRLELTTVDLQELLEEVVHDCLIEAPSPTPEVEIDAHYTVRIDRARIRQVFDNLVSNAFKYTLPGEQAKVQITAVDCGNGYVRVEVADRGIGVPPGQERLIFEEFHRVPGHSARYPGTGLGLAICRRIIERHHGAIAVRPREGGGTCVDVSLPA